MPNLRPYRDYDEHDVINLFKYSGNDTVNKGTFVKIVTGWTNDDINSYDPFAQAYPNTVSMRYGVRPAVTATATGDVAIGMTLYDVRESDENGEKLIFSPQKAAEMQAVLSGQAVPIVTRGIFLYSGVAGTVTAGANLYATTNGELTVQVTGADPTAGGTRQLNKVGIALGPKGGNNLVLIKINTL